MPKKIPQSVTVTVRNGKNFRATRPGKTYEGEGMSLNRVLDAFPKTPLPPYKVTYSLDKRGKFKVDDGPYFEVLTSNGSNSIGSSGIFACFLPKEWDGCRVSRKVEAIRKKGK